MFTAITNYAKERWPGRRVLPIHAIDNAVPETIIPSIAEPSLQPIGFNDFLNLNISPRQMLLHPILPERSLAMLYAPRGIGKSWLGLSIGLAVASGRPLLRWSAPKPKRVLYVDGEMPLVSLQERLRAISLGLGEIPNNGFRILAADYIDGGLNLGTEEGQHGIEHLVDGIDLLILDNLSTLCSTLSESGSDSWTSIQSWLLNLRRRGISVLFIHHAGNNGRQRGTSRREDTLDTVIALRRPEDYSPEHGARFEIHFEKLRNRVDGLGSSPFEAIVEPSVIDGRDGIKWLARDLAPPVLKRAAVIFRQGKSVRAAATILGISKSESGRLRQQAMEEGLLVPGDDPEGLTNLNGSEVAAQFEN
jgi:putative DNA primase/helicase